MVFLQNILGLLVSLGICLLLSWNKKDVPWKTVGKAIIAEFVIAFIIVKIPIGAKALKALSDGITALLNCVQTAWSSSSAVCGAVISTSSSSSPWAASSSCPHWFLSCTTWALSASSSSGSVRLSVS